MIANKHGVSLWGNESVLKLHGADILQLCEYTKNYKDSWCFNYVSTKLFFSLKQLNVLCMCENHFGCVRLCNSVDYGPPGSSVHGILQARTLEWVALTSSRGSS